MPTLSTIEEFLLKARRRLSDENPDYSDMDEEQDPEGLDSEVGEGDEVDDADKWLKEHEQGGDEEKEEASDGYTKPFFSHSDADKVQDADLDSAKDQARLLVNRQPGARKEHQDNAHKMIENASSTDDLADGMRRFRTNYDARKQNPSTTQTSSSDDLQPTREELANMREYTRPWEQRARDKTKLEAEAHVNPIKHHQGRLIEARNTSHGNRQKAYDEYTKSPEFQNADPITQMEMESKFHDDWHKQNPEHLMNALTTHHEAHKKGSMALDAFNQAKDEKIRHIASGSVQPGSMSAEEGMQHVGGSRDDEDSGPTGIQQDKGAAFASGNQEFMQNYMKNYDKKAKKFSNVADMDTLDPETRADVGTVLGDHPMLKDPAKKRQVDQFVEKYHPLIGKAARHVLSKLGLTDKANRGEIDPGILHEAGVHALFQATNDYDHDHPSKAKFTTHLNRKMHGLMQSALKAQDEIPDALRSGAKKFDTQRRAENAAPVKHTNKEGVTTIIPPVSPKRSSTEIAAAHHPDVQDRLKRVTAARAPIIRKQGALQPKPASPKVRFNSNINSSGSDDSGEE